MLEARYQRQTGRLIQLTSRYRSSPDEAVAASIESARLSLAETAHALQRIAEGRYGVCEHCGVRIPRWRLLDRPQASLCPRCDRPGGESGHRGRPSDDPATVTELAAVGIDLGSGSIKVWASGRPLVHVPTTGGSRTVPARLLRRGRITDPAGLRAVLTRLVSRYHRPLPAGPVVVAFRPVPACPADEAATRGLLADVLAPCSSTAPERRPSAPAPRRVRSG